MRESSIERYFVKRVKDHGGDARKLKGRRNETDRLVLWTWPLLDFVELKKPGEKPRRGQLREHARLRKRDYVVFVIDSKKGVDDYIAMRGTACTTLQ